MHAKLGFLFFSMSSYDNAIRSFQESVNFDPSDAAVFAGMGRAYEAKSDFVQAVSAFKKALDLQPSSEEYRTDLERAEKELSAHNEETERLERDILSKKKSFSDGPPLVSVISRRAGTDFFRPLT